MGRCKVCGEEGSKISSGLGACLRCIREKPEKALNVTSAKHAESRSLFGLPAEPPKASDGILCGLCPNNCRIGRGGKGFCGLVFNVDGQLRRVVGTPEGGVLEWYYDGLPTNCVAWWFCPGCTGSGFPKYAYKPSAELGYVNLAVFYGACSFDCLFCQNWHYRRLSQSLKPVLSAEELASKVKPNVSCICFFGGDPSVQMPHALKTSELGLEKAAETKRILRICWETNGHMREDYALKAAELSFVSGGVVKFDLKAFDNNLYRALCGSSNKTCLENFRTIGEKWFNRRPEVPVLTASTLLVPGYVDVEEVENISKFIASVDPNIPYTLLAYYPQYMMKDLPTTCRKQAQETLKAAKKHLKNVNIGNINLLQNI
ncbi:MAG: radical SAM protein [Candidatus Bathyarchaeia archaeon]